MKDTAPLLPPRSSAGEPHDVTIPKPRWFTLEFLTYYVVIVGVLAWMVAICVEMGDEGAPFLTPESTPTHHVIMLHSTGALGRLLGRRWFDNSDKQYRDFRKQLPSLIALATAHVILSRVLRWAVLTWRRPASPEAARVWDARASLAASLAVLVGMHGAGAVKLVLVVTPPYFVSRLAGRSPVGVWFGYAWGLLLVLGSDTIADAVRFGHAHGALAFLDGWTGIVRSWSMSLNFQALRVISNAADHREALERGPARTLRDGHRHRSGEEKDDVTCPACRASALPCDLARVSNPRPAPERDSLSVHLAYCLYAPLRIAGPVITFNDFCAQLGPGRMYFGIGMGGPRGWLVLAARWLACLALMEVMMHYLYVTTIGKLGLWEGKTPFQVIIIGYFILKMIWLKLLIIWRLFRLWSMADGITPVENLGRCMSDNYSSASFWRSWHRSFNRWIVRYLYAPLGGSRRRLLNTLIVFTFVAAWHEVSWQVLSWSWLIVLGLLPEAYVTGHFKNSKYASRWWWRHVAGLGCVFNILAMMLANLVGFSVGPAGGLAMVRTFASAQGLVFFSMAVPSLYACVQIMYETRLYEQRHHKQLSY